MNTLRDQLRKVLPAVQQIDRAKKVAAEYERIKIERLMNESFAHMLLKPLSCETCRGCVHKCGMARQLRNLVGNDTCTFRRVTA